MQIPVMANFATKNTIDEKVRVIEPRKRDCNFDMKFPYISIDTVNYNATLGFFFSYCISIKTNNITSH